MTSHQSLGRLYSCDHGASVELLVRLKKALTDPSSTFDTLLRYFREFEVHQNQHMRWEEEILFPILEERITELSEGPGPDLRRDHDQIRRRLRTLTDSLRESRRAAGSAVDEMISRLQVHHQKEEQLYYRLADSRISEAEFSRIATLLEVAEHSTR